MARDAAEDGGIFVVHFTAEDTIAPRIEFGGRNAVIQVRERPELQWISRRPN
jgi:hypothetical protein